MFSYIVTKHMCVCGSKVVLTLCTCLVDVVAAVFHGTLEVAGAHKKRLANIAKLGNSVLC